MTTPPNNVWVVLGDYGPRGDGGVELVRFERAEVLGAWR